MKNPSIKKSMYGTFYIRKISKHYVENVTDL